MNIKKTLLLILFLPGFIFAIFTFLSLFMLPIVMIDVYLYFGVTDDWLPEAIFGTIFYSILSIDIITNHLGGE